MNLIDFRRNLQLLRLAAEASSFVDQEKLILNSPLRGCLRSFFLGRLARDLFAQSRYAVGYAGSLVSFVSYRILNRFFLMTFFLLSMKSIFITNFSFSEPHRKVDLISRFNHEFHDQKVFKKQNVVCSSCHNFSPDKTSGKLVAEPGLSGSAFKKDFKAICHECHTGSESRNKEAPKTCFTCHRSSDDLKAIKPRNHANLAWSTSHGTEARIDGQACLNCHLTSQCVQCHQRRNDIELKNHSRNFRFTHSIVARAQPHRCDSCHSKTFCIDCHMGRK